MRERRLLVGGVALGGGQFEGFAEKIFGSKKYCLPSEASSLSLASKLGLFEFVG